MTALRVAAWVVLVAAFGVSTWRWLRVAQREHYIAGSCSVTLLRWIRVRPPNVFVVSTVGLGTAATVVLLATGHHGAARWVAVGTGTLDASVPWAMHVVGRPPVKLTRRARTLLGIFAVLSAALGVVVSLVAPALVAMAAVAAFVPYVLDGAMAVAVPLERRSAERFRRQAEAKLRSVGPRVVAVTGSWGKTSTKNHVRDLLAGSFDVVASPASWNNTAGLSRTMNEHLTPTTEVLVAEMGMYGPGEIRELCSWVRPNVAVITAVGPMHMERVGSIEGIVAAKAEILERADHAVLWVGDERLAALAGTVTIPLTRVGPRGSACPVEVADRDGSVVVWIDGVEVGSTAATGLHAGNVGCAVAAALAVGVSADEIGRRLAALSNPDHRATAGRSDAGVFVIDDTFNSNPSGARRALDVLAASAPGRRAVVTPGMVELGTAQDAENEAFARAVVESGATLVAVGWTNRRALVRGGGDRAVRVADRDAARDWVRRHLADGDGVLWENDLPDHYP